MSNNIATPQDNYIYFFYIFMIFSLGLTAWYFGRGTNKSTFQKIIVFLCLFSILFMSMILVQSLFPSEFLKQTIGYLIIIILPLCFFLMAVGIIIYGLSAIITRRTFVKLFDFLPPTQVEGPAAAYYGILLVITGSGIILLMAVLMRYILCAHGSFLCQSLLFLDDFLNVLGKILIIMASPLKFLGLIKY